MPPEKAGDVLSDQGASRPDLMAALAESLDRPTWVIHLAKHGGPGRSRSETWVGVAEDRDAANAAALAWVRDPRFYVSYADGPFVPSRERDRLRSEAKMLRDALDEIDDDLSVPTRPPAWAAHALQVAQMALASDEQEATS